MVVGLATASLAGHPQFRILWLCWGYMGIMEKKMGTIGVIGTIQTQQEVKNLVCRKSTGSRPQGPVGQVSRGLGARAPRAWGPAHQGPGPFPHKNHPIVQFPSSTVTLYGQHARFRI